MQLLHVANLNRATQDLRRVVFTLPTNYVACWSQAKTGLGTLQHEHDRPYGRRKRKRSKHARTVTHAEGFRCSVSIASATRFGRRQCILLFLNALTVEVDPKPSHDRLWLGDLLTVSLLLLSLALSFSPCQATSSLGQLSTLKPPIASCSDLDAKLLGRKIGTLPLGRCSNCVPIV
jgi:hypothetical protein